MFLVLAITACTMLIGCPSVWPSCSISWSICSSLSGVDGEFGCVVSADLTVVWCATVLFGCTGKGCSSCSSVPML